MSNSKLYFSLKAWIWYYVIHYIYLIVDIICKNENKIVLPLMKCPIIVYLYLDMILWSSSFVLSWLLQDYPVHAIPGRALTRPSDWSPQLSDHVRRHDRSGHCKRIPSGRRHRSCRGHGPSKKVRKKLSLVVCCLYCLCSSLRKAFN